VTSNSAPAGNRSAEAEAAAKVESEADSKAVSQDDSDDAAAITPDVSESDENFGRPGPPLSRLSPFRIGFFGGLGLFVAWWLGEQVVSISSVLIQIVVALFLAARRTRPPG
jgi:hypothetical protein